MVTNLPLGIRTPLFALLVACAGWFAVPFISQAQLARVSFSQAATSPLTVGGRPTTPKIADFNGDGRADFVVALEGDHAIAVLLGRPQGGFQPAPGSPFHAGNSPFSIAVADLNGDTQLDVVAVNQTDNQLTVLRGDGLGGFSPLGNPIPTGKEPRTVRIADFNRDGKPDLAVANYAGDSVSILLGDGSGAFTPAAGSPVVVGRSPWGLTVADFNADGAPDFAAANRAENSVSVMLNDGNARFTAAGLPIPVGNQPFDVTSADLNHDSKVDLVSADTWSHAITTKLGDGAGSFTPSFRGDVAVNGSYPRMVASTDFNLDGNADLVTANEHSSLSLLAGNGSGSFNPLSLPALPQPGIVNTVAVGDLNGDGAPDLVGCGPHFGLSIWLNTTVVPAFVVSAPQASESDSSAKVTLRRTVHTSQPLSFLASTRDDTAKAGLDYTAVQTRIEFAANQTEIVLSIPLLNDDFGAGPRRFFIEFSEANTNVSLPWAVPVEVRGDDDLVTVRAEVGGPGLLYHSGFGAPILPEGAGPIRFTARRSGSINSSRQFQVHYRVEGRNRTPDALGFGAAAAIPGKDFIMTATEGVFQFGPGVTEQSVEVSLSDDTVPQGNRGIAFRLIYEDIVNQGGDEAIAFILDDERSLLRQEVAVEPYMPAPIGERPNALVRGLADGRALVIRDMHTVMRLTPEGLPDLTFGRGRGRAVLPPLVQPEDFQATLSFDRELEDGRLQFQWLDTLVRLTADGVPDLSFGTGAGKLLLPGALQDTTPDGGLLLISGDGRHLKRLLPDGSVDPKFSTDWTAETAFYWARVAPQGQIWAFVDDRLHLFHTTGEPVLGFVPRLEVELFLGPASPRPSSDSRAFFDAEGRAYFGVRDSDSFGDPTQGSIVRFLADGTYDSDYRPVPHGVVAKLGDMNPNGTALAIFGGIELVELDASGRSRPLFHNVNRNIGGARWRSDGTILLAFTECGGWNMPPGCWISELGILTPGGQVIPIEGRPDQQMSANGSTLWVALPAGAEDNYDRRLFRSTLRFGHSTVGTTHSGRYVQESAASVGLQRAGSTASAAKVRGRVFPLVAGQWNALSAQPFEVEFPAGQAEAELALPHLAEVGRQPLREYLVRLESATGMELSEFTACRLWVLDDEALPGAGGSALERFGGTDEQNSALLLEWWEPGKQQVLEFRARLDLPWEGRELYDLPGFSMLGPAWLRPVPTDGTTSGFFRMRTP